MPDIKLVLQEEIRRLARKELKNSIAPLAKQLSEQKRVISELKKQVAVLEKALAVKAEPEKVVQAANEDDKKLRLNAAGIVKIRTKLGLSQRKLADLIGVSGHTVSLWEIGKVSPRANAKAAICALRTIGKKDLKRRLAELSSETNDDTVE
jgi:DNA-binding transcriptional regulator YiaG